MRPQSEESPHDTNYVRRASASSRLGSSTPLSPELHRDLSRRLAGVAISYSGTYVLAYGSGWVRMLAAGSTEDHAIVADIVSILSIALGIIVFWVARRGKLTPASFANVALAFQVLGAAGIMATGWGWEHNLDLFQRSVWEAIGAPGLVFPEEFVERLLAARVRLVYFGGVPWVAVWMLVVPILLPMTPRRTLVGMILSAAMVPALALSVAVHGAPVSVRPWITDMILDMTVPTVISAGLAFFCARTVYALTRDLSRAQQLGSYQLVERIGSGGMGEVWRARHQLLARPAAIKLIRAEMLGGPGSPAAREVLHRFEREAQATALLRSPHTVELYDFGVAPDGSFFYVMELLEGFDLKTLVERFGPLPPARVIHLLSQVCHSLEDAHRSGLVHRDVKPSNIFTCRRGLDYDFVKVLDFGLVKDVAGGEETVEVSLDGVARGTPAYMAPEAATGAAEVNARSDIYALGCVAYWLVTGELVFTGPTPVAILLQHARDQPVAPSTRLGSPVPAAFEGIVMACLSKDPAARPASAAALAVKLAECAAAIGPWTPQQAENWWRTHAPEGT